MAFSLMINYFKGGVKDINPEFLINSDFLKFPYYQQSTKIRNRKYLNIGIQIQKVHCRKNKTSIHHNMEILKIYDTNANLNS